MNRVRPSNERLEGISPYDAKNLPAEVFLSANENPKDVPAPIKNAMLEAIAACNFNRYPDPMAHGLRRLIADANGLSEDCVLLGNGGDEHLFNIFLAYGGPKRKVLICPPTFSVYAYNAHLTDTEVVEVACKDDFSIDEEAVIDRVGKGDIDIVILTSPNNPTGNVVGNEFIERLLEATDALVLADEAYGEFSCCTSLPLLQKARNLLILHTFSKAYALAGVRIGYLLGSPEVIAEFTKVRQPYSVDALSQIVATVAYENRAEFAAGIQAIVDERAVLYRALQEMDGVEVYPSESNFLLIRVEHAHEIWERLYRESSVLVRDFSSTPLLEDCLRVTVGTKDECERFLAALKKTLR